MTNCNTSAWDCSAWVRTYGLFLEERLECFRVLKYDVEGERLGKLSQDNTKVVMEPSFLYDFLWMYLSVIVILLP